MSFTASGRKLNMGRSRQTRARILHKHNNAFDSLNIVHEPEAVLCRVWNPKVLSPNCLCSLTKMVFTCNLCLNIGMTPPDIR